MNKEEIEAILMTTAGNKPRKGRVHYCLHCTRPLYVNPHMAKKIDKGYKKFCDSLCLKYSLMKNTRMLICGICSKEFYCSPSQEILRNRSTCSDKCRGKLQSLRQAGKANPSWNGGKNLVRGLRYTKKMDNWRRRVFKRDDFTCQNCHTRGGYLEAHHLKPFAFFPKLRSVLSNGVTLCRTCHDKTKLSAKAMKMLYEKHETKGTNTRKLCSGSDSTKGNRSKSKSGSIKWSRK